MCPREGGAFSIPVEAPEAKIFRLRLHGPLGAADAARLEEAVARVPAVERATLHRDAGVLTGVADPAIADYGRILEAAAVRGGYPEMVDPVRVTLTVHGMRCEECPPKVERALAGLPGVRRAAADRATSSAVLFVHRPQMDLQALERAVRAAGFSPEGASHAAYVVSLDHREAGRVHEGLLKALREREGVVRAVSAGEAEVRVIVERDKLAPEELRKLISDRGVSAEVRMLGESAIK